MKSKLLCLLLFPLLNFSQSTANYDIALTTIWNVEEHTSVPGNAHWSPLVGATHSIENEFLSLGSLATLGVKDVAEFGDSFAFENEINAIIMDDQADQLLKDNFSPFAGNDSNANFTGVTVSEDFPLITLISMVAPSPDWFIAINSLNLRSDNPAVNNGWKETFTIDVFAYDAGTDDGSNYTSGNSANTPVAISMINGFPINGNRMATITFTYISSTLSTEIFDGIDQITLSPNPSKGIISLKNLNNSQISISIFDVLGKQVYSSYVENQITKEINLTSLNSGLYIVKLSDKTSKNTLTKKLILN